MCDNHTPAVSNDIPLKDIKVLDEKPRTRKTIIVSTETLKAMFQDHQNTEKLVENWNGGN